VWAALAMRIGGGHFDPGYWKCWRRSSAKRLRVKLDANGPGILISEPWDDLKCFHAGGEAKWWLNTVRELGLLNATPPMLAWPRAAICGIDTRSLRSETGV